MSVNHLPPPPRLRPTCRKTNVTQATVSPSCTRTTKRKSRMPTRLQPGRRGGGW